MIGQFYPFLVRAASVAGGGISPIAVRATSAATELTNDFNWLLNLD